MAFTRPLEPKLRAIRARRLHFHRKNKYAMSLENSGYSDLARKLRDCQETESLVCCTHCGASWWIVTKCRQRVCPLCSFEQSKERAHYLKAMTGHMQHPKLLTLTQPLVRTDPKEAIHFIRHSFAKLRKTKLFQPVVGGAYNIEVKPKEEGYHVHMHVLMDAPFLPYQRIFSAWKKILQTDCPQIDIRSATDEKARDYVAKYAAKGAGFDLDPDNVVRWYEATKGERLWATFGKWYNAKLADLDPDHTAPEPKATCPNCKAVGTVFYARDGPFIYGNQDWQVLRKYYQTGDDDQRPIEGAQEAINEPWTEEEIKERKCKRSSTEPTGSQV